MPQQHICLPKNGTVTHPAAQAKNQGVIFAGSLVPVTFNPAAPYLYPQTPPAPPRGLQPWPPQRSPCPLAIPLALLESLSAYSTPISPESPGKATPLALPYPGGPAPSALPSPALSRAPGRPLPADSMLFLGLILLSPEGARGPRWAHSGFLGFRAELGSPRGCGRIHVPAPAALRPPPARTAHRPSQDRCALRPGVSRGRMASRRCRLPRGPQ